MYIGALASSGLLLNNYVAWSVYVVVSHAKTAEPIDNMPVGE